VAEREVYLELRRLADEVLPALISRLEASTLGELEVRDAGWRIRLRRGAGPAATPPSRRAARRARQRAAAVDAPAGSREGGAAQSGEHSDSASGGDGRMRAVGPGPAGGAADGRGGRDGSGDQDGRQRDPEGRGRHARSPGVGYYLAIEDLATGRQVRSGDLLGHVDVLGVRHEVVAPVDGVISRLLAQPGEAVEYGQELVRVEPIGRGGTES
jgi:biotin carboxyl carrier protein